MGGTQSQRAEIIYEHSEEEFNETKDKLAEIVEMNYKVFNQLSHNASHLTKALMQRKKDIAQSIFNFISQGDHILCVQGKIFPPDVAEVECPRFENFEDIEFKEIDRAGEYRFYCYKTTKSQNSVFWREEITICGLPKPKILKEQIHSCIELFGSAQKNPEPSEEGKSTYNLTIPSDAAIKFAFSFIFPELKKFCNNFIVFNDVAISESKPRGEKNKNSEEQYHKLCIKLPVNQLLWKELYPNLWQGFSAVDSIQIVVMDESLSKTVLSYSITKQQITITCAVSGKHYVWLHPDSLDPVLENGELEKFDIDLEEENQKFKVIIRPVLQLFSWGGKLAIPEIHFLIQYNPLYDDQRNVYPSFKITICHVGESNTEKILSYLIPITEWKNLVLQSFVSELKLFTCPHSPVEDIDSCEFHYSIQVETPHFHPILVGLLKFFAKDAFIEESMLVGHHAAVAVSADFAVFLHNSV